MQAHELMLHFEEFSLQLAAGAKYANLLTTFLHAL